MGKKAQVFVLDISAKKLHLIDLQCLVVESFFFEFMVYFVLSRALKIQDKEFVNN